MDFDKDSPLGEYLQGALFAMTVGSKQQNSGTVVAENEAGPAPEASTSSRSVESFQHKTEIQPVERADSLLVRQAKDLLRPLKPLGFSVHSDPDAEDAGPPLNEQIQQLIIASCLLEPSLSHLSSEVSPLPPNKFLSEDFRHRCTALSTALLAPKCFLWASAGSLAVVSHLSSIWKTVPPIFFLGFVISLQLAQTESDAETRKAHLQTALDGLLSHSSHADAVVQHAIQKLHELENTIHAPDWRAYSFKMRQDLERLEEIKQASSTLDMTLRQTARKCEDASASINSYADSEEQLQRLLEMHKVENQADRQQQSSPPRPTHRRDSWSAEPLHLPKIAKRATWMSGSLLFDGGVLPVSPDSSNTSRVERHQSIRRRRPSQSVDHGNRRASPSPNLRRTLSARTAADSPLRQSAFSPQVVEEKLPEEEEPTEDSFDFGRSESYAKLTRQATSPVLGSPAQFATYQRPSSDIQDPMIQSWYLRDAPDISHQPASAPPMEQAAHGQSSIGAITGLLPSHGRQSLSSSAIRHHRRKSSTLLGSSQQSSRGPGANKRFSLLSQHSFSSQRSSPVSFAPGLYVERSSPGSYEEEEEPSQHILALQTSFDHMHRERRRFLCTLMAIDFGRLLSRSPEKLGDVSKKMVALADDMEHLQLTAKKELARLAVNQDSSDTPHQHQQSNRRSSWSPLLPGGWSSRRSSVHLSPFDMPSPRPGFSERRYSAEAASMSQHADFAPPASPLRKLRTSSAAFGSKRNNMSRGLRSIAAKLDIATEELQQRMAAVGADAMGGQEVTDPERERDLLAVHDSIRSDLEGLLRDWDESRVLLRTALHPEEQQKRKSQGILNDSALSRMDTEGVKDLDDSGDEPSLTHTASVKRASSTFSSEVHTPDRQSPTKTLILDPFDERTPTDMPALEEVFEAVANKDLQRSNLSREGRIQLAKQKRQAEEAQGSEPQQHPMLSEELKSVISALNLKKAQNGRAQP